MANKIYDEILARMNFDAVFAENKPLTDMVRKNLKKSGADQDWKATGWMDDLSAYLEGPDLQGNSEEVNSSLRELSAGVKHIKEELTSVKKLRSSAKDLPVLINMQARLDEFHRLTDYNYVMDPHFQALGGLIREFKSILDQRRYNHREENIVDAANKITAPVRKLPDDLSGFNPRLRSLIEQAERENIVLDKKVLQEQIVKLNKEIEAIEKSRPGKRVSKKTALLHQVPHMIGYLSEDGIKKLGLQRHISLINRMSKMGVPLSEKLKEDLEKYTDQLSVLDFKSTNEIAKMKDDLQDAVNQYAERKGLTNKGVGISLKKINLNKAAKEDEKVSKALADLSRAVVIEDEQGRISGEIITDSKKLKKNKLDDKIIKEILKYEDSVLDSVKDPAKLKEKVRSIRRHEEKGGKMSPDDVMAELEGAEAVLKHPDMQALEELKQTSAKMQNMITEIENLEKDYTELKNVYDRMDEPISFSVPLAEAETAGIVRQLTALFDKREAAKGDHSDSTEYTHMINAVEACKNGPTFENMENLQREAQRYLDAKLKWDMFHLKPTKLRYERLDYAREIIEFAKQNKKFYEPAQIPDKFLENCKDAADAAKHPVRNEYIGDPECRSLDQLIRKHQRTTIEKMNERMDKRVRETRAALGLKPAVKNSRKVL